VSGKDYCGAYFDGAGGGQGLLIWLPSQVSRETRAALIVPELPTNGDILDHLVRGAQQASRWLRRLDSAQALLYQDEVTGLYNYRYLDVALDSEFKRLQRFHLPFSLLFIDLDNFKQVNDTHGHLTGSSILRQVGTQIKIAVRDVDVVIRYGGDEFVVVLIGTNSAQALLAAERVRSCVERHDFKAENSAEVIRLSTSIGVASCPEHGRDKFTIISLADETMYVAKRSGKNRVVMVQTNSKIKNRDLTSTLHRGNQ
jgi:diguanylate cyclase (GGDEF)-like protein